jgi:cobalt/nickel transport system ATP-binding protein
LLKLESVSYAYPDGRHALRGVSFVLRAGESLGLVGANGAGKSTLLQLLPGVLLPTAGAVYVGGARVDRASAARIRREVGLVMQEADDQLFTPTVYDDVAFGPRNMRLPPEEIEARAREAMAFTGVAHLAGRAPYRLSGGEKRRAAIAAVLAMRPALLAMDEPSASLDPRARRGLIALLGRLPQTLIIASHDLDLVWDACRRVVVLREGQVAADGPAREILADAALLEACGLELPLRFARG